MWMSIMILCANMNAQSCMVITGNELHTSKEKCFESAIEKANKAITYPQVHFKQNHFVKLYPEQNNQIR